MADYAYKERESACGRARDAAGVVAGLRRRPGRRHRSLAAFRSRTHGAAAAVGYGKSAMLFVMLRDAIGEDAFRRGVRGFWEEHRFTAASWSDLQAAFEKAAGRSLASFFEQWLDRAGGPAVKIAHARAKTEAGKVRLTLTVEQSAPAYALRLPLEIVFAGRAETRSIDVARPARRGDDARRCDARRRAPGPGPARLARAGPGAVAAHPAPVGHRAGATMVQASAAGGRARGRHGVGETLLRSPAAAAGAGRVAQRHRAGHADRPACGRGQRRWRTPACRRARRAWPGAAARRCGRSRATPARRWPWSRPGTPTPCGHCSAPLPHYGAQSWLVFDGRRALDRGVWPAPGPLIAVQSER